MEREDIYAAPQTDVSVADSNAVNLLSMLSQEDRRWNHC